MHCVKNVSIRSYSGPHFPAFGLNTERYGVSFRIQTKCGKVRSRITPNTDTSHAVTKTRWTLRPAFHNSATIEKLGNPCRHDYNYAEGVYIRTKLMKVLNLKPKLFLTLMPKVKKFLWHNFFSIKLRAILEEKNITRKKHFFLDV